MAGKFLTGKLGEMERIEKEGVGNYIALTFCSNQISQAVAR